MITTDTQNVKKAEVKEYNGVIASPSFVTLTFITDSALCRTIIYLPLDALAACERFAREINAIMEKKDES